MGLAQLPHWFKFFFADNCRAISRGIVCNRIRGPKETQYSRLSIFSLHLLLLLSTLVKCHNPLFNYEIWEEWCRGVPQSLIILIAVFCSVLRPEITNENVTAFFSVGLRWAWKHLDVWLLFPPKWNLLSRESCREVSTSLTMPVHKSPPRKD